MQKQYSLNFDFWSTIFCNEVHIVMVVTYARKKRLKDSEEIVKKSLSGDEVRGRVLVS